MLGGPDAFMQGGLVIARQDRHRHLGHDRPAVERVVDEVDRAAGDRDPVRERVTDGVGAGEGGQERGMRVEDAAGERGEDLRSDQPHVAGEHDRIGRDGLERLGERGIVAARDERRVDPLLRRPVERRALAIGEDEHDLGPEGAALSCGSERAQVRPRPGHADRDPAAHPRRSSGPSAYRPPSSSTGATSPIEACVEPFGGERSVGGRHGVRSHDRDHPDPAVEGRPKLVVLDPAQRAEQAHHRRHRPAARIESRPEAGRQRPRHVARQAATGDVGQPAQVVPAGQEAPCAPRARPWRRSGSA